MKKRVMKLSMCCLASGMMLVGAGAMTAGAAEAGQTQEAQTAAAAESADAQTVQSEETVQNEETAKSADAQTAQDEEAVQTADTDLSGQMAFAQCEEYINIRSGADTDSEVVAKIYNNGSATILEQTGDWYKIQSGNAVGYVKAEYFVTGAEAEAIAQEAAYNVAVVHPDELNVRTEPAEDTEVLDVAHHMDELEVVAYDGDWMKVALGDDVYGYVNAYYVDYKTYYPHAETLEEEQARLAAEQGAEEAPAYDAEEPSETQPENVSEDTASEPVYAETEAAYTEPEAAYTEPETVQTEAAYTESQYTETEAAYTETETSVQTEAAYTEPQYTETEAAYTETETPVQTEAAYTEPQYTETEAAYTETETPVQTEAAYTETEASSSSSTGQNIVDYAKQFIGNSYVWGGTSLTNGADCSGFTQSVFADNGINIARTAADQSAGGTSVSLDDLQPGDLLFYDSTGSIDHVAIYAGDGTIVHAANSNSGITTSPYDYSTPVSASRYW